MNKRLGKLLRPSVGQYLFVLVGFAIAALLAGQYILAVTEFGLTAALFVIYLLYRRHRRLQLQKFLQNLTEQMCGTEGAELPFPMAVIRLSDGMIVHANDTFAKLTVYDETLSDGNVCDLFEGFDIQWLTAGKSEYPYDVTLSGRRYRIYGTVVHADDPEGTKLGVLYLSDLTELYQVRDEYVRSRPVTSIILVDNYDELTRNMTEAAISALNSRINNTIM